MAHREDASIQQQARQLNQLINVLSLFTRKTMVEWLPKLESKMGITEQRFMVLWALNLEPGISLKDLAQSLVVSSSSLSLMVNAMVEQGHITRVEDPADRRRVLLRLTEQGAKDLAVAEDYLEAEFCRFLEQLEDGDRTALARVTNEMLEVMQRVAWPPEQQDNGGAKDNEQP